MIISSSFWFTADHHFSHANIIQHCNRPFSNVLEMNEVLIERWNSLVKPRDIVWYLGDFCWKYFEEHFSRLNGDIILVKGNHEACAWKFKHKFFAYHSGYVEHTFGKTLVTMCHYPMREWNGSHRGTWHLHGHSHGNVAPTPGRCMMDVGVDTHNYYPYSWDEIVENMTNVTILPPKNDV